MFLNILQLSLAVFLTILILLQGKSSGLGSVFGGGGNVYRTRRGAEKFLHILTVTIATVFFITSLLRFVL